MGSYDLIVIGAGWHGLVAAKSYLELHPEVNLLVLDALSSCGGTWAAERIYPGLHSNNLLDTYEYPDFPMSTESYGVQPGKHIPGAVMHRYLTDYAKKFGVLTRTRFNTKVESIEPHDGGWLLKVAAKEMLQTRKVVLATGLTSDPNFPVYRGSEEFDGPRFHSKDFYKHGDTVGKVENVTVVGGGKSAMDVAHAFADGNAHVDMVIREKGKGPVWVSYPWVLGGMKRLEKLINVRFLTWFSPCPFGGFDGWQWMRNLLHATYIGRFLVDGFWSAIGGEILSVNGYAKHPELLKLKPKDSAFWTASSLSIHNWDSDFFEMVRSGRISVHVADIDHLSPHTVHLSNGQALAADALVCATGWKKDPPLKLANFGPAGIGLPNPKPDQERMVRAANEEIVRRYPRLSAQPKLDFALAENPFRLYRFIVPPARFHDHNIAFAGLESSASTAMVANAQALWIAAFLDDKLDREPSDDEQLAESTVLHTQWGRWRYPYGWGASLPDFVFDAVPYIDLLLTDLGLNPCRKASTWAEIFHPYSPPDYAGLVEEWATKQRSKSNT